MRSGCRGSARQNRLLPIPQRARRNRSRRHGHQIERNGLFGCDARRNAARGPDLARKALGRFQRGHCRYDKLGRRARRHGPEFEKASAARGLIRPVQFRKPIRNGEMDRDRSCARPRPPDFLCRRTWLGDLHFVGHGRLRV